MKKRKSDLFIELQQRKDNNWCQSMREKKWSSVKQQNDDCLKVGIKGAERLALDWGMSRQLSVEFIPKQEKTVLRNMSKEEQKGVLDRLGCEQRDG